LDVPDFLFFPDFVSGCLQTMLNKGYNPFIAISVALADANNDAARNSPTSLQIFDASFVVNRANDSV